jgi:hypothetical protein
MLPPFTRVADSGGLPCRAYSEWMAEPQSTVSRRVPMFSFSYRNRLRILYLNISESLLALADMRSTISCRPVNAPNYLAAVGGSWSERWRLMRASMVAKVVAMSE